MRKRREIYQGMMDNQKQKDILAKMLIKYFKIIMKRKAFVIICIMLTCLLAFMFLILKYPFKHGTKIDISLNYSGIEKHENPDGTLFDVRQIVNSRILSIASNVIQDTDQETPIEDLMEMISIYPVIPPELNKNNVINNYFPNMFSLIFTAEDEKIFTSMNRVGILFAIIDEYREDFNQKYGQIRIEANQIKYEEISKYDYIDIINIYNSVIDKYLDYLNDQIKNAGLYAYKNTRQSFDEIRNDFEVIKNIDLKNTEAIIKNHKITKNSKELVSRYKDRIRKIEIEQQKKEAEALIANNLLKDMRQYSNYTFQGVKNSEKMADRMNLTFDVSNLDNLFKDDRQSILLETALKASVTAKNMKIDKQFLEDKILSLQEKKKEGNKLYLAKTENSLKKIKDKINILAQRTSGMGEEYLKRITDNAVTVISDPEDFTIGWDKVIKKVAFCSFIALLLSVIYVLIEHQRNIIQQNKQIKNKRQDSFGKILYFSIKKARLFF